VSISLGQVADIEFDLFALDALPDCKIEPKDVSSGVRVYPQKQVIFITADLDRTVEITPFETRLEDKFLL
jgi:hypothetical protein